MNPLCSASISRARVASTPRAWRMRSLTASLLLLYSRSTFTFLLSHSELGAVNEMLCRDNVASPKVQVVRYYIISAPYRILRAPYQSAIFGVWAEHAAHTPKALLEKRLFPADRRPWNSALDFVELVEPSPGLKALRRRPALPPA